MSKFNDLTDSALRKRFFDSEFKAENNIAIVSVRVSTEKQKQGNSIKEQNEIIDGYVSREGLDVKRKWEVAESASKHQDRKHFIEMIEFIKKSQNTKYPIKHLIFSFQSRSSRNRESSCRVSRNGYHLILT